MQIDFYKKIEKSISIERLEGYGQDGADECTIFARYLWNMAICESLYSPIQCAEIALRNAFHQALTDKYNTEYWFDSMPLSDFMKKQVEHAKKTAYKRNKSITDGFVVAELSFGFWTSFFNNYYQRSGLSFDLLKAAFPFWPKRFRAIKFQQPQWETIRELRNKVFHHERIIHWNDLKIKHQQILEAIRWISPELHELTVALDRFNKIHTAGIAPWKEKIRNYWPKIEG
jgi:Abi-like protein